MDDGLWQKEEFEDYVAKAIIGMYETYDEVIDNPEKTFGVGFVPNPLTMPTTHDITRCRQLGIYFPAGDRIVDQGGVDLDNDALPKAASWGFVLKEKREEEFMQGMIEMIFAFRISQLPRGWVTRSLATIRAYYKTVYWVPKDEGGAFLRVNYVAVDQRGRCHPAGPNDPAALADFRMWGKENSKAVSGQTSGAIQLWCDRQHLWNVECKEEEAKAIFGVYESQIKSLFYMRQAPMTGTGRKRPILHWVRSHRRRIHEGIDVDIAQHMRGVNEFEMDGTVFTITQPIKQLAHA